MQGHAVFDPQVMVRYDWPGALFMPDFRLHITLTCIKNQDFGNNLSLEPHKPQNGHHSDLEGEKLVYKLSSLVLEGTRKVPNM